MNVCLCFKVLDWFDVYASSDKTGFKPLLQGF